MRDWFLFDKHTNAIQTHRLDDLGAKRLCVGLTDHAVRQMIVKAVQLSQEHTVFMHYLWGLSWEPEWGGGGSGCTVQPL